MALHIDMNWLLDGGSVNLAISAVEPLSAGGWQELAVVVEAIERFVVEKRDVDLGDPTKAINSLCVCDHRRGDHAGWSGRCRDWRKTCTCKKFMVAS